MSLKKNSSAPRSEIFFFDSEYFKDTKLWKQIHLPEASSESDVSTAPAGDRKISGETLGDGRTFTYSLPSASVWTASFLKSPHKLATSSSDTMLFSLDTSNELKNRNSNLNSKISNNKNKNTKKKKLTGTIMNPVNGWFKGTCKLSGD